MPLGLFFQLLTTEKRLRAELEDLQIKLKDKNEQVKRLEGLADAGALQKLRRAEDSVKQMQKELSQSKQVRHLKYFLIWLCISPSPGRRCYNE